MKFVKSKVWQSYQYPFNSVRNSKSVKLKPLPESLSSHLNCWIRRRRPGRKGNGWPYTEGQVVPPSTTGWAMSSASSKKWGRLENSWRKEDWATSEKGMWRGLGAEAIKKQVWEDLNIIIWKAPGRGWKSVAWLKNRQRVDEKEPIKTPWWRPQNSFWDW